MAAQNPAEIFAKLHMCAIVKVKAVWHRAGTPVFYRAHHLQHLLCSLCNHRHFLHSSAHAFSIQLRRTPGTQCDNVPLPPCSCHHCCLSPGSHSAQHLAALLLWAGERTSARLIFPVWRRKCCSSCRRRSTWGLWNWSRMQPGQAPLLREQSLAQQPSSWHKHTEGVHVHSHWSKM